MEQILSASRITKAFPGVLALDEVEFSCVRGEVHALIGENGAGKSTLMKILAGAHRPDSGELTVGGQTVDEFTPHNAQDLGIAIVYQELSLLPHMQVAENIFLGKEPKNRLNLIDLPKMTQEGEAILERLDGHIDPRAPVYRLNPAQRQLVEIAKALSFNPEVLIMDEPSSSLSQHERDRLFSVIRSLKERHVTVIYISHHLEEVFDIADRVTVLKDGRTVGTLPVSQADRAGLIKMMVGREVEVIAPPRHGAADEVVLQVEGLTTAGIVQDVSFSLRKGEILGMAGLIGSGRSELAMAIFGAIPLQAGTVRLRGQPLRLSNPARAIKVGLALAPEDRKTEGLILSQSLRENLALPGLRALQRLGFINRQAEREMADRSVEQFSIQTPSIEQQMAHLSGGNQQKAVLAKWINTGPEVIIFDEPTHGIDVGAKAEIYSLLRQLADAGTAILMISSELPEILELSDRVLVMSGGQLAGELTAEDASEEGVLELAYARAGATTETPSTEVSSARPADNRWRSLRQRFNRIFGRLEFEGSAALLMLGLLVVLGAVGSDRFLTGPNLTNLSRQAVVPMLLAIGQTAVILAGGIDLSVSAIVTITNVLAAGMMAGRDERVIPVIVFLLAVGLLFGAVNAFAVIKLRVTPFIATLGTLVIGQGVALIYTREPIGIVAPTISYFAQGRIASIPVSTFFLILVLLVSFVFLYRTSPGRHIYAVGGDEEVARLAGISVNRVLASTYLISGALAAMTGIYLTGRMGSGDPSVGPGLELASLAAVLVGGTVLGGGRGGLPGTIAGVLVLVFLSNVFNQLGLHIWIQQIVEGLIIILAVSMYRQKD
ncbi:MAG: ATP-binding cassette domain-containing protein [Anaerolineales bacterium]